MNNSSEAVLPSEIISDPDFAVPDISPDRPYWGVWTGIGVWAISVALIVLFPSLFLLPYVTASGMNFESAADFAAFATTDKTAIIIRIAAIFPAHLLTLAVAWLAVTRIDRFSFFRSLGWNSAGVRWWHYAVILAGFFVTIIALNSVIPFREDELDRIVRSSQAALYLVVAMAVLTAPLVEEVVYRGVMFAPFKRRFGTTAAVVVVTAVFTFVHVFQYAANPGKIVLLMLLSLVLTLLRAGTGSLMPCVILHTLFNAVNSTLILAEPYVKESLPDTVPGALLRVIQ